MAEHGEGLYGKRDDRGEGGGIIDREGRPGTSGRGIKSAKEVSERIICRRKGRGRGDRKPEHLWGSYSKSLWRT